MATKRPYQPTIAINGARNLVRTDGVHASNAMVRTPLMLRNHKLASCSMPSTDPTHLPLQHSKEEAYLPILDCTLPPPLYNPLQTTTAMWCCRPRGDLTLNAATTLMTSHTTTTTTCRPINLGQPEPIVTSVESFDTRGADTTNC
jgi:hypothetical protein